MIWPFRKTERSSSPLTKEQASLSRDVAEKRTRLYNNLFALERATRAIEPKEHALDAMIRRHLDLLHRGVK